MEKDGKAWIYYNFKILPPFKFDENFDRKAAKKFLDGIIELHNLKPGAPEMNCWFPNEIETAYLQSIQV